MKPLILLAATIAMALPAMSRPGGGWQQNQGRERVVLEMYDAHYRGRGQIIPLKRTLKNQYPGFRLNQYNLLKVRLVAKSKHGRGSATLLTAHQEQQRGNIDGYPRDFHRQGNYYRTVLRNQDVGMQGPWQLRLDGNIKVGRIVMVLERKWQRPRPRPRPPRGGQSTYICEHRPDPFKTDKKFCQTNKRASGIQLEISKTDVDISFVEVTFGNGQTVRLHRLAGGHYEGSRPMAYFNGMRKVKSIRIGASSPGLFRKSKIRVYLLQ